MTAFLENASLTVSAISPVEIGLAYCQTRASPFTASLVKALSILASPLDYAIQIIAAPIWISFNDLKSNATLTDWLITPLRLPATVFLGTAFLIFSQCIETFERIRDIYQLDSDELYHQYKGKWTWLTQEEQPSTVQEERAARSTTKSTFTHEGQSVFGYITTVIRSENEAYRAIHNLIVPALINARITHFYCREWGNHQPPNLWVEDGSFTDDPPTEQSRNTSFVLIIASSSIPSSHVQHLKENGHPEFQMPERHYCFDKKTRLYKNLFHYNVLPLSLTNQLNRLL